MSVKVYKDGCVDYVDPLHLQNVLEGGWTLTPEFNKPVKPTFEQVDKNDSGKLSSEEVRDAAKAANIEGWDTKRVKTLKKELGLPNED